MGWNMRKMERERVGNKGIELVLCDERRCEGVCV